MNTTYHHINGSKDSTNPLYEGAINPRKRKVLPVDQVIKGEMLQQLLLNKRKQDVSFSSIAERPSQNPRLSGTQEFVATSIALPQETIPNTWIKPLVSIQESPPNFTPKDKVTKTAAKVRKVRKRKKCKAPTSKTPEKQSVLSRINHYTPYVLPSSATIDDNTVVILDMKERERFHYSDSNHFQQMITKKFGSGKALSYSSLNIVYMTYSNYKKIFSKYGTSRSKPISTLSDQHPHYNFLYSQRINQIDRFRQPVGQGAPSSKTTFNPELKYPKEFLKKIVKYTPNVLKVDCMVGPDGQWYPSENAVIFFDMKEIDGNMANASVFMTSTISTHLKSARVKSVKEFNIFYLSQSTYQEILSKYCDKAPKPYKMIDGDSPLFSIFNKKRSSFLKHSESLVQKKTPEIIDLSSSTEAEEFSDHGLDHQDAEEIPVPGFDQYHTVPEQQVAEEFPLPYFDQYHTVPEQQDAEVTPFVSLDQYHTVPEPQDAEVFPFGEYKPTEPDATTLKPNYFDTLVPGYLEEAVAEVMPSLNPFASPNLSDYQTGNPF